MRMEIVPLCSPSSLLTKEPGPGPGLEALTFREQPATSRLQLLLSSHISTQVQFQGDFQPHTVRFSREQNWFDFLRQLNRFSHQIISPTDTIATF